MTVYIRVLCFGVLQSPLLLHLHYTGGEQQRDCDLVLTTESMD